MPETGKLKLLPDTAWGEFAGEERPCGLGFNEYAQVLADVAQNTDGPFTIGVFGSWGTGKTSLMRRVKHTFKDNEDIVGVWFNAWQFEHDKHPIIPLIATIVTELQKNESAPKKLIRALRAVAYGFSAKAEVGVPGIGKGEIAFSAKDMIDREGELSDPLLDRSLYFDAFETLSTITKDSKKLKIVVFIDDLDRCLLSGALKLLESIKLVLAQPGFIFFLGLDRRIIQDYLNKRFKEEYGVKEFSGQEYLEKLVQLSFPIPSHTERIKGFADGIYRRIENQLDERDREGFEKILPIFGAACNANPRAVARYVNNLLVDRAIARTSKETENLPLTMFAISRALQDRWEKVFYALQRRDDNEIGKFLKSYLETLDDKDTQKSILEEWGKTDIISSKKLPPIVDSSENLQELLKSSPGREYLDNHEIRKACTQFFKTQRKEAETSPDDAELRETGRLFGDLRTGGWPSYASHSFLSETDMPKANLQENDLSNADLSFMNLANANLIRANLQGANLQGANLQEADLRGAYLVGTNLVGTNLQGANLQGANLLGASLFGASLFGTNLFGANLQGADMQASKLPGTVEEIKKICKWSETTMWPEESDETES